MKILIVGCYGQLGRELTEILTGDFADIGKIDDRYFGAQITGADIDTLDVTNEFSLNNYFENLRPDIVFNCSAYTNVDKAEEDEKTAYAVNATGCLNLAKACSSCGAKLVSVSTDYVFDGEKTTPYVETDTPNPQTVYGSTKLQGEIFIAQNLKEHFIVRTAWLYGKQGKNFVRTMLRLGKERDSVTVVNDQYGCPTYANDLAYHMLKIALTEHYGIYHCVNNGVCSWYDFAKEIMYKAKLDCVVKPITSEEYGAKVKRPRFSALENDRLRKTVGDQMRKWDEALDSFLKEIEI
ncbi:MAG TPA: dTDP-4-dehydrorhamnose reductase [Eubacteriales bacterium]|nr:dTDP-4-dehydrorhamnose reductase [Eubacteriales bacterium]